MGSNFDRKLYGEYPPPYMTSQGLNTYTCAPRQGPDNVALVIAGFQGMTPNWAPGMPTSPQRYSQVQNVQHSAAGVPTNANYGVYEPGMASPQQQQQQQQQLGGYASPASQYQQQQGMAGSQFSPRRSGMQPTGTGLFVSPIMTDHVQHHATGLAGDQMLGSGPNSPVLSPLGPSKAPGSMTAYVRNQDSLETFITGLAGGPQPKNKQTDFDLVYGARHAGKATVSHITPQLNGLQGPTDNLTGMPHMRTNRRGHMCQLESDPDGGYIPTSLARSTDTLGGMRVFVGAAPAAQDHLQVSPTGLTGDGVMPMTGRGIVAATNKLANISPHSAGLTHSGVDSGYPAIRSGPFTNKSTSSCLAPKAAGITEDGDIPDRKLPFAGLTSKSQMRNGEGGLGGSEPIRPVVNPHAGKGQASQLTYSSNTVTVLPVGKPEVRQRAVGKDGWTTTYDDTYTSVQVSQHQAAQRYMDNRPYRF